jgi:hypothetical protein
MNTLTKTEMKQELEELQKLNPRTATQEVRIWRLEDQLKALAK